MAYKTVEERRAAEGSVGAVLGQMTEADRHRFMDLVGQLLQSSNPLTGIQRVKELAEDFLSSPHSATDAPPKLGK